MKHKIVYQSHRSRVRHKRRVVLAAVLAALLAVAAVLALLWHTGVLGAPGQPAASPTPPGQPSGQPAVAAQTPTPTPQPSAQPPPAGALAPLPEGDRPLYELAAALDDDDRMRATLRLCYCNTTGDTLYDLVLRVYPNFEAPGALRVNSAAVDGTLVQHTLSEDGTLLTVPIPALAPQARCTLLLEFVYDIPRAESRCGKARDAYQLGNFLPTLAVYQDGGWDTRPFCAVGDPFYSELADYKIAFSRPAYYDAFVCTGAVVSEQEAEEDVRITYAAASGVRDFACVVSGKHRSATVTAQCGVEVTSWALTGDNARRAAQMAARALDAFAARIGPYPYETLALAQTSIAGGGMEYPGLVMIDRALYLEGRSRALELTIAHEVAHQWFYAAVGSDQLGAPWLDEALVSYLGVLYFDWIGEPEAYQALLATNALEFAGLAWRVDGALGDYPDGDAYTQAVYQRGAFLFYALRETIGPEAFEDGLQAYYRENAGRNADAQDLIRAFNYAAERDLSDWFAGWLKAG